MTPSRRCLDLIKEFEGCRLEAYQDSVGVWTIGWGHTGGDVTSHQIVSQAEADALLSQDSQTVAVQVENAFQFAVPQSVFDACVCFAFNLGIGNFKSSTLLKEVNDNNYLTAVQQFAMWNNAGGKKSTGLTRRRLREALLFIADL
jgi:lysozyme